MRIKDGDAASQIWALEGSYFSFLSTGFGGTITGVGASIGVIDDPVKNHIEANNEAVLDGQWQWYRDTFLSRIEEGGIIIIIMTRWSTRDLCGRLLEAEGDDWYVLRHPTCLDEQTHEMLCSSLMSWERYDALRKLTSREIMLANYQQEPIDLQGRLYDHFTTYAPDELPQGRVVSYTDTADTGADYLCCLIAVVHEGRGYVIDVVYTDAPMERTERQVARALYDARCTEGAIESNNGGRGFARNVRRILWEEYGWRKTQLLDHNQRQNKQARILTEAGYIEDNILFPEGWKERWSEYARAMESYQRKGKNAHDDAPDATTGLAEYIQGRPAAQEAVLQREGREMINQVYRDLIKAELGGVYGYTVLQEMDEIIKYYELYDGRKNSDAPMRTNWIKKLINDESRYMCARRLSCASCRATPRNRRKRTGSPNGWIICSIKTAGAKRCSRARATRLWASAWR